MQLNLLRSLIYSCFRYFLHQASVSALFFGTLIFFMSSFCSLGSAQAWADSNQTGPKALPFKALQIVTTVEPYRLIAKAALNEIAPESRPIVEITTLITQPISAHHASLKPSQRIALKHADVVIVSRLTDEPMLEKTIQKANTTLIDVSTLKDLTRHPARNNHTHTTIEKTRSTEDTHYWFEPHNAELIGSQLLNLLQVKYPENKSALIQAQKKFQQKMAQKKTIWQHQLTPLEKQRFLMFHDAYQYLEKWIGLKQIDWLTETDEHFISPQKWIQVEKNLKNKGIDCIISSAEANESFQTLQHKYGATLVKTIMIDDIARDYRFDFIQTPSPLPDHTYFDWMDWLAQTLLQCAPTQP